MEFEETPGGIVVPKVQPESKNASEGELPVRAGWTYSKCDHRYDRSNDDRFRMEALESLYIAVSPGGGSIPVGGAAERRKRLTRLIDELAVELVGGIPEGCEEYT